MKIFHLKIDLNLRWEVEVELLVCFTLESNVIVIRPSIVKVINYFLLNIVVNWLVVIESFDHSKELSKVFTIFIICI